MDEGQRAHLVEALLTQRHVMAQQWHRTLCRHEPGLKEKVEIARLLPLVERFVALLLREPWEAEDARRLGAAVAALCAEPEALIGAQEMLARQLGELLRAEEFAALQPRLTRLFGEMAAGFYGKARAALEATTCLLSSSMELRTPLNSIIGFSRLILREIDGPITEMQRKDLISINHSGHVLLDAINSLLDLTKIKLEKLGLEAESFVIEEMIRTVAKATQRFQSEMRPDQTLEVICGDDLGEMEADPGRTQQVILSLLKNVMRYSLDGTISLVVWRESTQGVESIVFEVRSPHPLPSEIHQEYRESNGRSVRYGPILEIDVLYHLTSLMGGTLTAEGSKEQGSVFTLRLPARMGAMGRG